MLHNTRLRVKWKPLAPGADPVKGVGAILHSSAPWAGQMWADVRQLCRSMQELCSRISAAPLPRPSAMLSGDRHILGLSAEIHSFGDAGPATHLCSRPQCKQGLDTFFFLRFFYFSGGSQNESKLQFHRNAQNIYLVWQKCMNFSERQKGTKRHKTGFLLPKTENARNLKAESYLISTQESSGVSVEFS